MSKPRGSPQMALHIGTDTGVTTLKAEDDGTWRPMDTNFPKWCVKEVVALPSSPDVLLAGTRGDGVWRSEDGGKKWTKPSRGRHAPGKVRCLTLDPDNENRIYAGCEPIELHVSDDLGEHWEQIDAVARNPWISTITYPGADVEPHLRDIAIDPTDPSTMYIALQVGAIMKTTDRGATWEVLTEGFDSDVHAIAIDPFDSQHLSISTGGDNSRRGTSSAKALFQSFDAGDSWEALALNFSQDYSIPYVLKVGQPEIAFSSLAKGNPGRWKTNEKGADGVLVRTMDDGQTWHEVDLGNIAAAGQHMVVTIATDANDPESLFAALSNGELIHTDDGGDSWSPINVQLEGINHIKHTNK